MKLLHNTGLDPSTPSVAAALESATRLGDFIYIDTKASDNILTKV